MSKSIKNGWEEKKIIELAEIKTGKYDANHAVDNGKYYFYTCAIAPLKANTYSFDDELIILPGNGANLGEVMYYNGKVEAYQRTYIIHNLKCLPKFLYYYLKIKWKSYIKKKEVGSATNYMKFDDIASFILPLPPLDEQIKIASILEKADKLRQKRKEANKLFDELLQSIFLDMFGDPIDSSIFDITLFSNVIDKIESGWSPVCHDVENENKWGVLKLSAVSNGKYFYKEYKHFPNNLVPKKDLEVKKGDLLITRKNTKDLVGSCAYVFNTIDKLMIPDTIFRPIPKKNKTNPLYLHSLFNNENFKKKVQSLASGSAASMINISKQKLLELEIPLPPIELQNEFAQIVEKIESLKEKAKESEKEIENLFNSLMQSAFSGELS